MGIKQQCFTDGELRLTEAEWPYLNFSRTLAIFKSSSVEKQFGDIHGGVSLNELEQC